MNVLLFHCNFHRLSFATSILDLLERLYVYAFAKHCDNFQVINYDSLLTFGASHLSFFYAIII